MKKDDNNLTNLINVGPVIAKKIEQVGIKTTDEFLTQDPFEVFNGMLEKVDPALCRCALASIVGANIGVVWHKIHKKASAEFDKRYPEHSWKNKC